ncbi:5-hydroxytryptamine receptor-like isoform X2 [Cimex lectularius]|nr:5-hydroxytryptamine receptor-like isoform X2 [Cimex lectularius]
MRGELVTLLKSAGQLCSQGVKNSSREDEEALCSGLSSLIQQVLAGQATPIPSTSSWITLDNSSWNEDNQTNATLVIDEKVYFSSVFMAVLSVILGIVILITIIGNVFVIAAILLERNLQNVANYLIVSLAVADLMVACLVMPLGAVYEINQSWILGPELCDMWTLSDVLCCTASILHLVAIAVDRYWAVTNVNYIHNRNRSRIVIMIVMIWTLAIVVSLAPQFGWKDPDHLERINLQQRCLVSQDLGYQIFATCSTFYVPLLVILVLYWKIFQTARKRIRRRRTPKQPISEKAGKAGGKFNFFSKKRLMGEWESKKGEVALVEGSVCETDTEKGGSGEGATTAFTITTNHGSGAVSPDRSTAEMPANNSKPAPALPQKTKRETKKETMEAKRERKAAKTLAIITGAFVVCWLPFFIMALLMPLCETCYINDYLASLFLWLGYFNSTLNPVIYTIFSPEFRQAFKRILCGVSHSRPRR